MPAQPYEDEFEYEVDLDAVIRRVVEEDDRAVIHRGKYTVAVIPVEDLELLEAFEDARDAADLARARAEDDGEWISHEELKAQLGL
ncbi:MAG: prevent-host-death family protein [Egibacteraceae bacterium]